MIDLRVGKYEDGNRKKSGVISTMLMAILILLLFLPLFSHMNPPPGQEGILVNLGLPDQGQGSENAPKAQPEKEIEEPATKPEPVEEKKPPPPKPEPKPTPKPEIKKTIETVDPEAIALRKAKEKKKQQEEQKAREEADEREREREEQLEEDRRERERQRKEAAEKAERERKAAEKAAAAQALKDKLKSQFGTGGSGSGKGNTGKPGSQGDPNGDPNSNILKGKSTGSGMLGGGLGERGAKSKPKISDNTQKQGRIVLRVCVDKSGNVISADYTQSGSNSADATLIRIAKKNAQAWKFNKGGVDKQCGTITYDFKLR